MVSLFAACLDLQSALLCRATSQTAFLPSQLPTYHSFPALPCHQNPSCCSVIRHCCYALPVEDLTSSQLGPIVCCLQRRQATAHSIRAEAQSPHASSPASTPHASLTEDRVRQAPARPSLDNGLEEPSRSAPSESGSTPRGFMNGATSTTTSGQPGKAVTTPRQPQVDFAFISLEHCTGMVQQLGAATQVAVVKRAATSQD